LFLLDYIGIKENEYGRNRNFVRIRDE
jgi:hypothetical protein